MILNEKQNDGIKGNEPEDNTKKKKSHINQGFKK